VQRQDDRSTIIHDRPEVTAVGRIGGQQNDVDHGCRKAAVAEVSVDAVALSWRFIPG
jgi:hypothetical protein